MLARLHLPGKGAGPSKVETAAALVRLLALAFPGRMVHIVDDAAYHGPALRTLGERDLDLPDPAQRGAVCWRRRAPVSAESPAPRRLERHRR